MRYIFSILLCLILQSGFSQIFKTVGISYTAGPPTYTPAKAGSWLALDTVTWRYYTWNGSAWLSDGFRVQTISGCSAPAYTPTKFQSLVVINNCSTIQGGPELYYWTGSEWITKNDIGIKPDSVYYVSPTSSYCKECFVQEYERKDSNLLVLVLGDSKTEETYRGPQQLSRKLVLSRGTSYGGPGFGSFASTPAQGNWFALSGVTIISGGVAEKSLNNKGLRLNTVGSYYEIFTSDPPWGNWKKITYTIQQEAAASSLTVTLDGVPSTVNIPSGSGLSTFSITAAANTTHTIRFTQLSGTTVLLNYYLTSEISNSTSVWNIGNSGSGANKWTNVIFNDNWDILKPYDPDMIIIRLGINDAFGGLGAAQFNTDMKSLLEKIKLKFPLTNITLVGTEQSLLGPSTYIEYNNVMATLSQDSCYSFVDMDKVWPDWAKATSIGLTSDDIHENTAGGEFIGKAYFEALMGRSDISVSSSSINYWKKVGSNVVREAGNVGVGLLNTVEKLDIFGTDSVYIKLNTGVSGSFASPIYNGIKFFGGSPNFQLGRIEAVNEISNRASGDIRFVLRNSLGTYTEAGRFSGLTGGLSLNTSTLEALFEGKSKGNTISTRAISLRNSDNNSLISVLDATGKAGVGILNPGYNWDIYGTNPILALRSNVFADNKKINFQTGSAVEGYISLSSTTLTLSSGRGAGWGSNIVFETDASTRMSISSAGAVAVNSLSGTGNRIVQASSTGILQSTTIDPANILQSSSVFNGNFSGTGTATTAFTVTLPTTQPDATYSVSIMPKNTLSATGWYISARTTTTFEVTYLTGLTGAVDFDYIIVN